MFNLNVIVGSRNAQASRGFKRSPRGIVQLLNECLQVCTHNRSSPLRCESLTGSDKLHLRDHAQAAWSLTSSRAPVADALPHRILTRRPAHLHGPKPAGPLFHSSHLSKTSATQQVRDKLPVPAES